MTRDYTQNDRIEQPAVELGVGQPKRTSLSKAIDGIRKRVQERRLLGHTRHEKG